MPVRVDEDAPARAADPLRSPATRRLRVLFMHTVLGFGGAESVTLNLVRRMDRTRFAPEVCCLKQPGRLGEELSSEIPVHSRLLSHKYDARVLYRLKRLMRGRGIDALVTVGAGDKMFWGRLAARLARVPVVVSAIHSTGWPDSINWLNRALTPLTDMFVGVASAHGRHLVERERFPAERVRVIPNGVDTDRFRPRPPDAGLRERLGLGPGPVAGVVARLWSEKNLELFLRVAALARRQVPQSQFVIIGDGPLRGSLEGLARELGIADCVRFLGWRSDIPELLAALDVFLLTSHNEANPISILEALATGVPVVATRVGSIPETVRDGVGFLAPPGDAEALARHVVTLFGDPRRAREMGAAGRQFVVEHWSLDRMVEGYQDLIEEVYARKRPDESRRVMPLAALDALTPRGVA